MLFRKHLRQVIEQVLDSRDTLIKELLGIHLGEWTGANQVLTRDTAASDDDLINGVIDVLDRCSCSDVLSPAGRGDDRNQDCG